MKTRKEKLLALALDRGATPEGQLAALRYLALCNNWQDVHIVDATRWWERPECGDGFSTLPSGCLAVDKLRHGIPSTCMIEVHAVHPTAEDAAGHHQALAREEDEDRFRDNLLSYVVIQIRTTPSARSSTVCTASTEIVRPNCRAQLGEVP